MGLMITFIFLFVAFIILTINYSKTIRVKNEVVSIIEKYEGLNDTSVALINNYLRYSGYNATGVCTTSVKRGVYGGLSLSSTNLEQARPGAKYYYCIQKYRGIKSTTYYQVGVFYKFNLPIIGTAAGFNVRGTTSNFLDSDGAMYSAVIGG